LGLEDQSRRPRKTSGISGETVLRLIELRRQYPKWGAKKMQTLLITGGHKGPAPSTKTIARIYDRAGEPRIRNPRRRLRLVLRQHQELDVHEPNDVWTVDFKGWWRTMDGKRFEPLTVRDAFSRMVLAVDVLPSTGAGPVRAIFERLFKRFGLPKALQFDNGIPFVAPLARGGLTALSAWWVALGIELIRSRPGCPQDNGAHERMHADMAAEIETEPSASRALQQRACDRWRQQFNHVRPHDAIGDKTPAEVYKRSQRATRVRVARYPLGWIIRLVSLGGTICVHSHSYFISASLIGHRVGLEPVDRCTCASGSTSSIWVPSRYLPSCPSPWPAWRRARPPQGCARSFVARRLRRP